MNAQNELIDLNTVTTIVEALIAERGEDYTYQYEEYEDPKTGAATESTCCTYTNQAGKPSCIVGHVLAKVAPDAFRIIGQGEWDVNNLSYPKSKVFYRSEAQYLFTDKARYYLSKLQEGQDYDNTWSSAHKEALSLVEVTEKGETDE